MTNIKDTQPDLCEQTYKDLEEDSSKPTELLKKAEPYLEPENPTDSVTHLHKELVDCIISLDVAHKSRQPGDIYNSALFASSDMSRAASNLRKALEKKINEKRKDMDASKQFWWNLGITAVGVLIAAAAFFNQIQSSTTQDSKNARQETLIQEVQSRLEKLETTKGRGK